jgi:flagellar biosynthesis protein FliQ
MKPWLIINISQAKYLINPWITHKILSYCVNIFPIYFEYRNILSVNTD